MSVARNVKEVIASIQELREQVGWDEGGGGVVCNFAGRYSYTALPMEINETILRLIILSDKLETALKEDENV